MRTPPRNDSESQANVGLSTTPEETERRPNWLFVILSALFLALLVAGTGLAVLSSPAPTACLSLPVTSQQTATKVPPAAKAKTPFVKSVLVTVPAKPTVKPTVKPVVPPVTPPVVTPPAGDNDSDGDNDKSKDKDKSKDNEGKSGHDGDAKSKSKGNSDKSDATAKGKSKTDPDAHSDTKSKSETDKK